MEEQTTSSNGNATQYSVGELYKKSWEIVKKNLSQLLAVTAIGVLINVAISVLLIFVIINNLFDSTSGIITGAFAASIVGIIAGTFVGLLQLLALKRVSEGHKIEIGEIVNQAWGFVPRAFAYSLFVTGVVLAAGLVSGLLTAVAAPLGLLAGLAVIVGMVIAAFRYAFLPFLVVEPKETAFLERFNISERMTRGIYGIIFLVALVGVILSIAGALVSAAITAPFSEKVTVNNTSSYTLDYSNIQTAEDLDKEINKATKDVREATKQNFSAKYLITEIISQAISWGIGLVVIGAMLELYKQRKHIS